MSTRTADGKPTAFIVDDESMIALAIAELLTAEGIRAISFHSPSAAIEALECMIPDFVVTDFAMPGMDGLTLAASMVQKNPGCKVVVLSGNPAAMNAHPDRHRYPVLQKPASLHAILKALRAHL